MSEPVAPLTDEELKGWRLGAANGATATNHNVQRLLATIHADRTEIAWDADFIAAARADIPALLSEIERLRTENANLVCKHCRDNDFVKRDEYE